MNPTIRFETWGKGFSGCDGGNLHGSVWFCGIEWGAGKKHDLDKELNVSVSDPPQTYEAPEDIVRDRDSGMPYPFGVKLAKLIAAMRGMAVCDYYRVIHEMPFPFHRRSDFFKLNLYPVAFRKVDAQLWVDKYKNATGLSTREEYLDWCRRNRFPEMRLWMERGQPKLIVGIGTTFKNDFFDAFGSIGPIRQDRISDVNLTWSKTNARNTRVAVIPFLGYTKGSLNSDRLLQAFGKRLSEIHDGC